MIAKANPITKKNRNIKAIPEIPGINGNANTSKSPSQLAVTKSNMSLNAPISIAHMFLIWNIIPPASGVLP
jgi:hypothetical protein